MKKITFILFAMLAFCWQGYAQDTCGTALPVTPGTTTGTAINVGSGGAEMAPSGADSVFFAYTATADGTINVDSCLGGADTDLSIGTGACGALTGVVNNDDSCDLGDGDAFASEIQNYAVVSGQTYYIEWSNEWSPGPFDWTLSFVPTPDCTPAVLDPLQAIDDCAVNSQYSIVVPFVSEGDATGVSDGVTTFPIVDGAATAGPYASGETVNLTVVHSDPLCDIALGDLVFNCPENQDTCATADAVTDGTYTTTINAGSGGSEMGTGGNASAFFAFTAPGDGTLYVNSCEGGADSFLNIGSGVCGDLFVEGSNDDSCASGLGNDFASEVTIDVTGGTTYYIEWDNRYLSGANTFDWTLLFTPAPLCTPATIDSSDIANTCDVDGMFTVEIVVSDAGDAGSVFDDGTTTYPVVAGTVVAGPYNSGDSVTIELTAVDPGCSSTVGTFTFLCPQPQDICDTAEAITPGTYTTTITQDSGGTIMGVGGDSAFFTYTPTEDGEIYVNSCLNGGNADTNLNIGTGPCNDLTTVASNDDSCDRGDGNAWASEITISVTAGTTYVIEWDDRYTSGANTFDWTLEFIPPPACTPATIDSSTVVETCNPDGTGTFTVEIEVTDAGDAGSVFSDGTDTFPVVAGTVTTGTYNSGDSVTIELISLDEDCSSTVGTFDFTCPPPAPENDDVSGATNLPVGSTVCETMVSGTNIAATDTVENDNEADCGSFDPAGDVWFKVMVPATGELTIETSIADTNPITDTLMTVYSGTSGALVEIACSDDEGPGLFSLIELTGLNPGDVLLVRVWEFQDNLKGNFNICAWSPTTLGVDDNTFDGFTYFPNPVKDVLTLESPRSIDKIEVFNVLGQRIVAIDSQNTIQNIDMSNVQAGAYFVKVSIGDQIKTIRVIKE